MFFKLDTKEKFYELEIQKSEFSAILTDELNQTLPQLLSSSPFNVILNLSQVSTIELDSALKLAKWQYEWYENGHSFVICNLQPAVEEALDKAEILELLNHTPTLSEAWDIVQIEEIERELLD